MEENSIDWVSVSEVAKNMGVSKQSIYNYIKEGRFATKTFKRGSMRGVLVCVPKSKNIEL